MRRIAGGAALALAAILLGPHASPAQNFGAVPETMYRATVTRVVDRHRGPAVTGYVENTSPNILTRVRLHVRALDASGQVVSETDGTLLGDIPPFGRGPFEIPLKGTGARYEVTIVHAEPLHLKGGM